MDSISWTLSRAPAASSSASKRRPVTANQAKSFKNPPTFKEVCSLHEAICQLLDSLAATPSDQSPKCNAICWEVAAEFPAIPLRGEGQGQCFLAQAKLDGLLGERSDATELHKALIEKIAPRIDTLFDWLDWMPKRAEDTSAQQLQHDMTGIKLAGELIKQGEALQGTDGSFFPRMYRPNGIELNNYALSSINLVIAHPEIAQGFAAVLSGHFAYEGGTPDVDVCYLQAKHEEVFGPGTWAGADEETDPAASQDKDYTPEQTFIAGVRLAAELFRRGTELAKTAPQDCALQRKHRPQGRAQNDFVTQFLEQLVTYPDLIPGFSAVFTDILANCEVNCEGGHEFYLKPSYEEIKGPGTADDDEPESTVAAVETKANEFLGPQGRSLALECSYEIESLTKLLIQETDGESNGSLVRALAARAHNVNSIIMGYLGEDDMESLKDRYWDVYRTAMVPA